MANTAIRIGYISVSTGGGGGGDGFKEYSDLASFPPAGELNVIYLANDTKKLYKWNGLTYLEISPSEVTSVNTYVGDVVLDKSDVGLDQVDNTSDADKPISDATQIALDGLDSRATSLENINDVLQIHAYEDNLQIWGSAQPPMQDPLINIVGNELTRDGWYYENQTGEQIGWYFFDGTSQATIQKADFSAFVVLTMDVLTSKPIIGVYSFPTGSGDILPGFAHSRWSYQISTANLATMTAGKKYLLYVGVNPDIHPEIPHIPLTFSAGASGGDLLDTEVILTSALISDPTEPAGEVKWMVESLGVWSTSYKHEMALRFRKALDSDLSSHVLNTSNPHSVTADQVGLGNVDNTSDLDKPISTAVQDALDLKEDALGFTPENVANKSTDISLGVSDTLYPTQNAVKSYVDTGLSAKIDSSEKGAADGVAPLNSSSKIDATYLPSYVDDVLEYADLASFPITGESGKLYIALDTNLVYRWTGSVYVEVSPTPALTWGSITGTLSNQTDLQTALDGKFDDPIGTTDEYIRGDGSLATFPTELPYSSTSSSLISTVFNNTGAVLPKFTVVYLNGGQGDLPTVAKAQADSEPNSSKTYGIVLEDISNMTSGLVIIEGALTGVDTDQFNPTAPTGDVNGTALWLSPTVAGGVTTTKPLTPNHLVFIGTIVRTHQNEGIVDVRIQNGYELEELHDVLITSASDLDTIIRDSGIWVNRRLISAGDIAETSFSISNNQSVAADITDFSFSTSVRSFNALVSVEIDADSNLFESVEIKGIQKDSDWDISIISSGDSSGISFSITSSGQLQYTSSNYSGFVSGFIKFRAITTSV